MRHTGHTGCTRRTGHTGHTQRTRHTPASGLLRCGLLCPWTTVPSGICGLSPSFPPGLYSDVTALQSLPGRPKVEGRLSSPPRVLPLPRHPPCFPRTGSQVCLFIPSSRVPAALAPAEFRHRLRDSREPARGPLPSPSRAWGQPSLHRWWAGCERFPRLSEEATGPGGVPAGGGGLRTPRRGTPELCERPRALHGAAVLVGGRGKTGRTPAGGNEKSCPR